MLPTEITLWGFNLNVFGVFLLLGFLVFSFVVWQEGTKDGFDEEHLFDLLLISVASGIFLSRLVFALQTRLYFYAALYHTFAFWTVGMSVYGAIVGFLISIYFFSKWRRWSIYRVLDVFSLAWCLFLAVTALGFVGMQKRFEFLFAFGAWIFLYAVLVRIRNKKIGSGVAFSIFLFVAAIFAAAFFGGSTRLPLYILLIVLGMVNLYFRGRVLLMKTNIPTEVINKLKERLRGKESRLVNEQTELQKEDPYMAQGRAEGNSEFVDEANEDIAKTVTDVKLSGLQKMQMQVRKALAKIKLGTYGICEVCKKPIDTARLLAYPEATTCIDHAKTE